MDASEQGFTFIELIAFIIVTGLVASTLLLTFSTALKNTPLIRNQSIATLTAERCMEWLIGQRRLNGYSSLTCPSTTTPAFCTTPSGYSLSTNISCTTLNSDASYMTATVSVSGKGSATLTTLLANS